MKTMHKTIGMLVMVAALAWAGTAAATVSVSASADIRVWLDDARDVYPSYDNVAISIRSARDCYATVFVIDTDGFVHIVRPFSPYDDAWIRGGCTYRYTARELGLARLGGRGVAHVFAIASPYPFDYSPYGAAIFAGGFGYRVYGDPFVACREIYVSLLPASCRWELVGVGFARFYIREWSRYPHYLCRGHMGVHVRVGDYCRSCAQIYDGYRVHVADPYVVIHPRVKFREPARYAELKRSTRKYKSMTDDRALRSGDAGVRRTVPVARREDVKARTVSSSRAREAVAGWTQRAATERKAVTRKPAARTSVSKSKAASGGSKQTVATRTIQPRSKASSARTQAAKKGAERGGKSTSKKSR